MRKLKIYLDTSVISHLKQDDVPDKMADTLALWEDIKQDKYDVYISETTMREVQRCKTDKLNYLMDCLNEIEYTTIIATDEMDEIAEMLIENKILTRKSYDDCIHIASAIVSECDYILSWNFKHIANIKTNQGVKAITAIGHYKDILLIPPTMFTLNTESEV